MKNLRMAPIGAKVICILMTVCMLSLTACTNSSNTPSPTQSGAGFQVTNEPTKAYEHTGVNEPHHEIDPGVEIASPTPEPTAEPTEAPDQSGKYSYTIYDDIVITMDVNIDDYIIINNAGEKAFRLYQFAHDFGWTGNIAGDKEYTSDIYSLPDGTQILYGEYSDIVPGTSHRQFRSIAILTSSYLSRCEMAKRDCDYVIGGVNQVASYDDIVVICYTLWLVSANQETDPFVAAFGTKYHYVTLSNGTEYKLP